MQVKLSNWQVRHDFRFGPEGAVIYNPRMDLVGVLTYNGTIGQPFILVNHNTKEYDNFSDAIIMTDKEMKKWVMVDKNL